MLLLISDANILMDIEVGDLVAPMFSLNCQFAVPDLLYFEELEGDYTYMRNLGLQVRSLDPQTLGRVVQLSQRYYRMGTGRNDLSALALAEVERCSLLTGDAALRKAAEAENVPVKGTLWLLEKMLVEERISVTVARASLQKMRANNRRLPWDLAEKMLTTLVQDDRA